MASKQDNPQRFYLVGRESLLIHAAEQILEAGHVVCGVISRSPRLREWAESQDIDVIDPGKGLADRLTKPFDYFASITHLSIVPNEVLAKAEKGTINFHDGPLPRYAGLYAPAWALMNQEARHGVTWHAMTEDVDAGGIYVQRVFDLRPGETSYTLNTRCYEAGIETFGELLADISRVSGVSGGKLEAKRQPEHEPHYFGRDKRPSAAATLDWRRPASELEALVRALDFGPVDNPLALPKFAVGERFVMVAKAEAREATGTAAPGELVSVGDVLAVATGAGELVLRELICEQGHPIEDLASRDGLKVGTTLAVLSESDAQRITEVHQQVARYEPFWSARLSKLTPAELPHADRSSGISEKHASVALKLPGGLSADDVVAALAAFIGRASDMQTFDVGFRDESLAQKLAGADDYFVSHIPLHIAIDAAADFASYKQTMAAELSRVRKRGSYARDMLLRFPELHARSAAIRSDSVRLVIEQVGSLDGYQAPAGAELAIAIASDGSNCAWHYDGKVLSSDAIALLQRQLSTFLNALALDDKRALSQQPILSEAELQRLLVEFNATETDYPRSATIHGLFEEQVRRTPDAPAVAFLGQQLSYAELNERANKLAHHLRGLGVGPDVLTGVCVERSPEMLIASLGVLKAGGAYVPMDPEYPKERLALMLEDSEVPVLISQRRLLGQLPHSDAKLVCIDSDWNEISKAPASDPEDGAKSADLAYTIYTSGSTGRPKGVMVEHRNVVNFFAGMDERVGHSAGDQPGVWLALTSLSFDIAVLELFWTLARGFKIVLHSDKADDAALGRARLKHADKSITFSLMYFASDEGENESSADKYKLLIEGAKFGDRNGFKAVWTPERHFHAFGGLYPNPSVAGAAIATITENIRIRAASVVMPLHNPIRVAEEWALVDNLSSGRVGISFAAGWQPNDFVIYKPERYADRKQVMLDDLQAVRALWRGEKLKITSPLGKEHEVTTYPRPVQKELPFWVTAAGNPETFRAAGEIGANMLSHLLGQTVEQLREKIAIYREAWDKAGHPGRGSVTIMLHTFVGEDEAMVKETVRGPMKEYLGSSLQLIKLAAYSFPTFKKKADATGKTPAEIFEEEELSPEDMDVLLEHSFERYYVTSGLFGTPSSCLEIVDALKGCDVDDIGCLLDYGVPSATVLTHLAHLNELKDNANAPPGATEDYSLAAQVERHGVTHMQCTPSQLTMILAGSESRAALRKLRKLLVGGEAFPASVVRDVVTATDADIVNMYGPTETTIWSSTHAIDRNEQTAPIGRPIANTQLYILNKQLQPVPLGVAGELYIGGDGVVRGYHGRKQLTDERFVPDPWRPQAEGRMYRTGDLARYREDGVIEFLGRVDFQVKLRGYRIELGEIETYLAADEAVREAVVVAREDVPGDKRLVAYLLATDTTVDVDALRSRLKDQLPPYMVPQNFVVLKKYPLTPNNKVDRKALPAPDSVQLATTTEYVAPSGKVEEKIAEVWTEVLNVKKVGMDDNFFDLGGHSLLTVQVHRKLKDSLAMELALTDLFRFPTIRALVGFIENDGGSDTMDKSRDRAAARKEAMAQRAKRRGRRQRGS